MIGMDAAWQDELDALDAGLAVLPSEDTLAEAARPGHQLSWAETRRLMLEGAGFAGR